MSLAGRSTRFVDGDGRAWRVLRTGVVLWLGVLVLLAVFAAYLDPHLALDLANRFWSCF